MPPFRWEDIDHSLVRLRLIDLAQEMHGQINADKSRIQFENRGNLSSGAIPSLILQMEQNRADEWARRVYEIYCSVWKTQGNARYSAFVRAISARAVLPTLQARTGAIAAEFSSFATRTSFPHMVRDAMVMGLRLNMQRLEDRWRRRLEIEAKECDHAEKIAGLSQPMVQSRDVVTREMPTGVLAEPNHQPTAGESRQPVHLSPSAPNKRKPGRSPKLPQAFVVCAGTLWRKAISDSHTKVSDDQLRQIVSALDAAGHLPPALYLEGKCAQELKDFNSRNSNSKIGPVKTWSQLVSRGDKDLLRGTRRLFSRCAKKLDDDHPLSGN